jgi:hypothetical protein
MNIYRSHAEVRMFCVPHAVRLAKQLLQMLLINKWVAKIPRPCLREEKGGDDASKRRDWDS